MNKVCFTTKKVELYLAKFHFHYEPQNSFKDNLLMPSHKSNVDLDKTTQC